MYETSKLSIVCSFIYSVINHFKCQILLERVNYYINSLFIYGKLLFLTLNHPVSSFYLSLFTVDNTINIYVRLITTFAPRVQKREVLMIKTEFSISLHYVIFRTYHFQKLNIMIIEKQITLKLCIQPKIFKSQCNFCVDMIV